MNRIYVDLLKSRVRRKQPWRWVAKSGDNYRVLAISGEWYTNKQDCLDAISLVFGNETNVYLRSVDNSAVLRTSL